MLGLKAIFSEAMQLEIVHLSVPGALDDANLAPRPHRRRMHAAPVRTDLHLPPGAPAAQAHRARQRDFARSTSSASSAPAQKDISPSRPTSPRFAWPSTWCATARSGPRAGCSPACSTASAAPRQVRRVDAPLHGRANSRCSTCCAPDSPTARSPLALGIDEGTVKAHIGRLMRKVGVNNRIALTVHPFTQPN